MNYTPSTKIMIQYVKRFLYSIFSAGARAYWRIKGGRVLKVMGRQVRTTPNTVFPTHRRLSLPSGNCRSEIVRYADFVQMHACCQYLSTLDRPTIVDVGAHHGAYALVLGKIAQEKAGRVIALEPHPVSHAILRKNVSLNGLDETVVIEEVAVMETRGTVALNRNGSQSHVVRGGAPDCVNVRGERLSGILERHGISSVELLIIDVEGAELPVLRSFPWGEVSIGRIFCELHPYNWNSFGYSGQEVARFLSEQRLRCWDMFFTEHTSFHGQEYLGACLLERRLSS